MSLLILIIILALVFDYINGFHDAANSIATVVSTKVLTPFQAVVWAAFFNFVAYFIFSDHAVANTIGKIVNQEFITLGVILAGLIAAIFWNLLTWWYGIPSSSSHTLIGGFAGAAICHAVLENGFTLTLDKIVDSPIIMVTVAFIFLAPLIGMLISMFITTVTVIQNIWLRFLIIALATFASVLLFDKFENNKMNEGVAKFFKVDKYQKDIAAAEYKIGQNATDVKAAEDLKSAQEKLNKVLPSYEKIVAMVKDFNEVGAAHIAKEAYDQGLLHDIAPSKLKDEIRNANGYLVLEAEATSDSEKKKDYKKVKQITEDYKTPAKAFLKKELPKDSLLLALHAIYPLSPSNMAAINKKIDGFNIQTSLQKTLDKADNSMIVNGVIFTSIFFCLVYLYVERIKTPNAYKMAEMFKKLQLYSSAAFSVGHGGNDAQKVMGIIGAALIADGSIQEFSQLPNWVPLACYAAIGIGTMSGGWKIVKTMGTKITKVTPLEGVSAESAGAFTLFFTSQMGIPVSTTHTITGSIIGVGATKRLSAVRWGVTISLLWAWILTIPVSALAAALCYYMVQFFGII
jgi:PiT family inorganic phosphate transporter